MLVHGHRRRDAREADGEETERDEFVQKRCIGSLAAVGCRAVQTVQTLNLQQLS